MFIRKVRYACVVTIALTCTACLPQKELRLAGKTMGTTYTIKVVTGWLTSGADIQAQIDNRLAAINRSMSTYDPASEISRFNALASPDDALAVSDDFINVLQVAARLYRLTDGAWDGTLDPLINLWGFGRHGPATGIPAEPDIRQALARVGFDRIRMDQPGVIGKHHPEVTLDLASIAKGYVIPFAIFGLQANTFGSDYPNFGYVIKHILNDGGRRGDDAGGDGEGAGQCFT